MDDAEPATEPANPPPRQGRWRRFVRGRAATLTVGLLVGALLGAAGVAWQTDTVPFLSGGEDRLCWGAFSQRAALRLMPDLEERDSGAGGDGEGGAPWSEQLPSQHRGFADQDPSGECRIGMGDRSGDSVTVRVHQLDQLRGDDEKVWPDNYLSPDMTSFGATGRGNGGVGMASPTRAWRKLPDRCNAPEEHAPYVVDMSRANGARLSQRDGPARDVMARAVTQVTNTVAHRLGCHDSLSPPGNLPAPPKADAIHQGKACGVDGLRWPRALTRADGSIGSRVELRNSGGSQHGARVCAVTADHFEGGDTRFLTIEDANLAHVYQHAALYGGKKIEQRGDGRNFGTFGSTLTVFQARCQRHTAKHEVDTAFVGRPGEDDNDNQRRAVSAMFPRYVTAEAKRIGCGNIRLTMPE